MIASALRIGEGRGMDFMGFQAFLFLSSVFAGLVGAVFGLGGGIVIVPVLTLILGIDIRHAIGASLVGVIATSSGAAAAYVRDRITNIRVAMVLEVATTLGALGGFFLSAFLNPGMLYILFGVLMAYSGLLMLRNRRQDLGTELKKGHPWAERLGLNSSYPDAVLKREIYYTVHHIPLAMVFMAVAGALSGLLGIGGGSLKVPAMDAAMKLPIKVSSATSNFMIGVTAAASAGAYFMRGDILPSLAGPVALGVLLGAWIGARLMTRMPSGKIRTLFVILLIGVALQMLWKGFRNGI